MKPQDIAAGIPGRHSIAWRLAVLVMATLAGSLLLAGAAFIGWQSTSQRQELLQHSRVVADLVGANGLTALAFDDPKFGREVLATLGNDASITLACLYTEDGQPWAAFSRSGVAQEERCPAPEADGARFADDRLHLHRPIRVDEQQRAHVYLEADTRPLEARLVRAAAIVAGVILLTSIVVFVASGRLRKAVAAPLEELVAHSQRMATGDLSMAMETDRADELGMLTRAFGGMAQQLRNLVARIRSDTGALGASVDTLNETSERIHQGAIEQHEAVSRTVDVLGRMGSSIGAVHDNVAALSVDAEDTVRATGSLDASIGGIAERLEELFTAISTTATASAETTASIDSIAESLEGLHHASTETSMTLDGFRTAGQSVRATAAENRELSARTAETARSGLEAVRETIGGMDAIRSSFDSIEGAVSGLSSQVESIHAIVEVINSVADESGLLALNAHIIAAQAGDHGLAFAVVAQQIKELAKQTQKSAGEIAELISRVQGAASTVAQAVFDGSEQIRSGSNRSSDAETVLRDICEIADELQNMGGRIDQATLNQEDGVDQLGATVRQMEQIVSQIGRATGEQRQASRNVANAAASMQELGDQVRSATEIQRRESNMISRAMERVKSKVDDILGATRAQSGDRETFDEALAFFQGAAGDSTRRAAELEALVADLSARSQDLAQEIDRFRV